MVELFAHDFAGALSASDEAIKLDPKDLAAQTNRAHALLFMGRTKDAEAIYLDIAAKKFSPTPTRNGKKQF